MSSYKLYYFPFRGRGELIRFVFAQAGVQYEDVRVPKEEWGKLKPGEQARGPAALHVKEAKSPWASGDVRCRSPCDVQILLGARCPSLRWTESGSEDHLSSHGS